MRHHELVRLINLDSSARTPSRSTEGRPLREVAYTDDAFTHMCAHTERRKISRHIGSSRSRDGFEAEA